MLPINIQHSVRFLPYNTEMAYDEVFQELDSSFTPPPFAWKKI